MVCVECKLCVLTGEFVSFMNSLVILYAPIKFKLSLVIVELFLAPSYLFGMKLKSSLFIEIISIEGNRRKGREVLCY